MSQQVQAHRPRGHKGASAARGQEAMEVFPPSVRKRAAGGPDRSEELELEINEILAFNEKFRKSLGHLGLEAS